MLTQPRREGLPRSAQQPITLHAGGDYRIIFLKVASAMYSMQESRREQLQRLFRPPVQHPLSTTQRHVAWENGALRVECNLVRNMSTLEDRLAVRIVPAVVPSYTAVVVSLSPAGELHVIGRYRYPLARWSIEFPRFEFESGDAGWKAAAEGDLFRLTGLEADRLTLLGALEIDPALLATSAIVILAEGCRLATSVEQQSARPGGVGEDNKEQIKERLEEHDELVAGCVALSLSDLDDLVKRGDVTCGVTLAALALYRSGIR